MGLGASLSPLVLAAVLLVSVAPAQAASKPSGADSDACHYLARLIDHKTTAGELHELAILSKRTKNSELATDAAAVVAAHGALSRAIDLAKVALVCRTTLGFTEPRSFGNG